MFITGTPNWALTVKTTVPTSCTPPFRKFPAVECHGVRGPRAQVSALKVLEPSALRIVAPQRGFYQEIRLCTFIRLFVRGSQ